MSAKLRLAVVRARYTPFGGAERFIAHALPALEAAGTDVTLITREWPGWDTRRVIRVDPFHLGRRARDRSFARAARAAWRRRGFDLVQSHERIPGCDVYRAGEGVHRRWLEIRAARAPAVTRLALALSPYHRYVCAAERAMFEHPRLRAVICDSRMVREDILRGFRIEPDKLHVIYNGIDLEQFNPGAVPAWRGSTRAEIGCGPRDTVFLFVGTDFERKGLDTAIEALAHANSQAFWLVVIGQDRDLARYEAQARRAGVAARVRFVGAREDVRPYYAAADCFVLPSRYDPFPNAVLEALAMGLPAIVSERCGAAEVLRERGGGFVTPPDDTMDLARSMHQADRALRDGALQRVARATAERFGVDAMGRRLVDLYAQLAHAARAPVREGL
ncbi:MAG: glycosyltransferase family 4 protein [Burkholderiales bacterium]|nr:glycosyltransferase family 4 protein [Burkholderiales bacterium]